jgi:hypothetical protein
MAADLSTELYRRADNPSQPDQLLPQRILPPDVFQRHHLRRGPLQDEFQQLIIRLLHRLVGVDQASVARSRAADMNLNDPGHGQPADVFFGRQAAALGRQAGVADIQQQAAIDGFQNSCYAIRLDLVIFA